MNWLDFSLLFGVAVLLCFTLVLFVGAPYVPTLPKQTVAALHEVTAFKGNAAAFVVYELGSGDGTVMKALAKAGVPSVGYELNPLIWLLSVVRLMPYRKLAQARFGNFWQVDIGDADVIFVFLHPRFMRKLDTKITQEARKKIKLISFAFEIPDKKPTKKVSGLFVYDYEPQQ